MNSYSVISLLTRLVINKHKHLGTNSGLTDGIFARLACVEKCHLTAYIYPRARCQNVEKIIVSKLQRQYFNLIS